MAWNLRNPLILLLFAGFFVGCWGCQPSDKAEKGKATSEASKVESSSPKEEANEQSGKTASNNELASNPVKISEETPSKLPEATPPKPVKPAIPPKTIKQKLPPPGAIPEVHLSDKFRATCLVKVGDELPNAELADIAGNKIVLKSLYGEQLTVVIFWNAGASAYARQSMIEALGDMQKDILEPFAAKELKVIGINVGDQLGVVKGALQKSGARYPTLLDPQGDYFKSVATERLPRIYLLDASGKILWFDMEYARATRRDLQVGVKAVLGEKK
jgi:peroxiredoxin